VSNLEYASERVYPSSAANLTCKNGASLRCLGYPKHKGLPLDLFLNTEYLLVPYCYEIEHLGLFSLNLDHSKGTTAYLGIKSMSK
jgi:hypothetical protein